jgi:hypothetical protein
MVIFGIFFILIILLLMPINSAFQFNMIDNKNKSIDYLKTHFSKYLTKLTSDTPPQWFTSLYKLIILSLYARIGIITPLAIIPNGEPGKYFEINSYFFFLILLTLVYRFAFWYNFFDKIAEKNNWELP